MNAPRFVVDTMLGRLARWLRAMGYDTLYLGPAEDRRLLQLAQIEERILLTRDARLARLAAPMGCLIEAGQLDHQLAEVVQKLTLSPQDADWLSRCLECNGLLEPRQRASVSGLVPEYIFATQSEFTGCPGCGRIYWAGSHADRMLTRLAKLLGRGGRERPETFA
ncbi:MAG: Mut7-C RNAse domain-containing protein [Candidatus Rokubacteria bacterium]|nr:Mut7-C RNAse domain-containing protein [Candidatus Rokubacteria bacterium]